MRKTEAKRIVIMGATSGIGKATALLFQDMGWTVGIAGRRAGMLSEIAARKPEHTHWATIDVTADDAPEKLYALIEDMGGTDVYLHCSGIGYQNRALNPQIELDTIMTNAEGFVRMVTAAYQYFSLHGGGHIAAITSIAGTKGLGAAPAYSATKRLQNIYIDALEQLACKERRQICFTDIRPGFVDTPLLSGKRYPMLMPIDKVARLAAKDITRKKRRAVIDMRYSVLVALWRLIPNRLWKRLNVFN